MNIFDLLDDDLDLIKEYRKIIELFDDKSFYRDFVGIGKSLNDAFNEKIQNWKYRGTSTSTLEIFRKLHLNASTTEEDAFNDILKLIQLALNIKLFLERYYEEMDEFILFKNIEVILNKLNFESYVEEDRVMLIPKNTEVLTSIEGMDKSLKGLLVEYLNFEIKDDIKSKKRILTDISFKIEPKRKDYNKINKNLTDNLFHLFNKVNIRHNNKEGDKKNEVVAAMTDSEIIYWYDKTYEMIIYLLNQDKNNKNMKEVNELIRKMEEK